MKVHEGSRGNNDDSAQRAGQSNADRTDPAAATSPSLDLSVVVPVYNSARTLKTLVERLVGTLDRTGMNYEIVLVNDGSGDDSWNVLADLQSRHPGQLVTIDLMRNFGQHNALMCGFRHSRGELIVTMDDDLQNPPEEIPKLISAIQQSGMDLVYGKYTFTHRGIWRRLASRMIQLFFRVVVRSSIELTSCRILRRKLADSILKYDLNFTFIDGLLAWNTERVGEVPVDYHPRADGRSGYSLGKLFTLGFNLVTNFSLLPLQMVTVIGLLAATAGFLGALAYLVLYLSAKIVVPGYASTIIAVLFLGGVQLLSLGIIGEYLGRVHLNINRKPQYTIREYRRLSVSRDEHMAVRDESISR